MHSFAFLYLFMIFVLKKEMLRVNKKHLHHVAEPSPSLTLTNPQNWYPLARNTNRKIIYHHGPTNSGKTYNAIQALKNSKNGLYCAPLRLLAWEIFEKMNKEYKLITFL